MFPIWTTNLDMTAQGVTTCDRPSLPLPLPYPCPYPYPYPSQVLALALAHSLCRLDGNTNRILREMDVRSCTLPSPDRPSSPGLSPNNNWGGPHEVLQRSWVKGQGLHHLHQSGGAGGGVGLGLYPG